MRTEVNKVSVNREADYTLLLITASVCQSKSGPDRYVFIPDLITLDLYYKDAVNYNSYKELVTNTGCQLYMAPQYSEELEHPYYSLRLTGHTFLPVVYPRSNLDYQNWIPKLNLVLDNNTADNVYLGSHTFAYRVSITEPLNYPCYFVVPHLQALTAVTGNTIIWFGSSEDTVPPRPAEDFNGEFKVLYDPTDPDCAIHQIDAIRQIVGKNGYNDPGSGQLDSLQYETYDNEDGSLTFYSPYANLFLDYKDMGSTGSFTTDQEFNYDLMVLAAMNIDEYGEDTNEFLTLRSILRGPRCQGIKINLTKEFQTNYYSLRVELEDYIENFRFTFTPGPDYVETVMSDSLLLRATSTTVYNGPNVEYEFRRLPSSLIEDTYIDDMIIQWDEISETDYLIYVMLDDGLNIPRYHTFLANLATQLNAFAYITTDARITMDHDRAIAFNQSVSNQEGSLFSYLPELKLMYTQDFLGDVGSYLIGSINNPTNNVNQYDIQQFGCSINKMVSTDQDLNLIVRMAAAQFTKRFTFLCNNIISLDSGYVSALQTYISSVLAVTPLVESAQIDSCTKVGRNTLNIKVSLTIPRLVKDTIVLNFVINI